MRDRVSILVVAVLLLELVLPSLALGIREITYHLPSKSPDSDTLGWASVVGTETGHWRLPGNWSEAGQSANTTEFAIVNSITPGYTNWWAYGTTPASNQKTYSVTPPSVPANSTGVVGFFAEARLSVVESAHAWYCPNSKGVSYQSTSPLIQLNTSVGSNGTDTGSCSAGYSSGLELDGQRDAGGYIQTTMYGLAVIDTRPNPDTVTVWLYLRSTQMGNIRSRVVSGTQTWTGGYFRVDLPINATALEPGTSNTPTHDTGTTHASSYIAAMRVFQSSETSVADYLLGKGLPIEAIDGATLASGYPDPTAGPYTPGMPDTATVDATTTADWRSWLESNTIGAIASLGDAIMSKARAAIDGFRGLFWFVPYFTTDFEGWW